MEKGERNETEAGEGWSEMGYDGGLEKGEGWREGDGGTQVVVSSHRSSSQGCMCVYGACSSYRLALCNSFSPHYSHYCFSFAS